ncbi:MAG: glutathione binding-like protein [Pseudomonadota bacterium]
MLKLFYAPNTIALASLIALEEVGADYEPIRLDFQSTEQQGASYLKINPKGRVPALVTERGILTETPAILAWIAQSWPDSGLAPVQDLFAFAEVQSVCAYLCSTAHVAHAHKMRGHRWTDDDSAKQAMTSYVPRSMAAAFQYLEDEVFQGPWVMGEAFTIADPYLFTIARWLEGDGVDPEMFPKIHDHRTRMEERKSVQTALATQLQT